MTEAGKWEETLNAAVQQDDPAWDLALEDRDAADVQTYTFSDAMVYRFADGSLLYSGDDRRHEIVEDDGMVRVTGKKLGPKNRPNQTYRVTTPGWRKNFVPVRKKKKSVRVTLEQHIDYLALKRFADVLGFNLGGR